MSSLELMRLFLAVAQLRSFTQAARSLHVSPTAVSKGVRALEKQHGVILFTRTTRSVSLTDAGAALLAGLKPAVSQIEDAFTDLARFRQLPAGRLRLTAPRALGYLVTRLLVPRMRAAYPEITFDLSLDDGKVDLVAAGYDAGIRLGQAIAQDMVAVRLSRPLNWSVVASPGYVAQYGLPRTPQDLAGHQVIRYRFPSSQALPAWTFTDADGELQLDIAAALTANDTRIIAELARDGLGMAYLPDLEIVEDVRRGLLVRALAAFVPPTSGLFLYFPLRSQHQPKMRALIKQAGQLAEEGLLDARCV